MSNDESKRREANEWLEHHLRYKSGKGADEARKLVREVKEKDQRDENRRAEKGEK